MNPLFTNYSLKNLNTFGINAKTAGYATFDSVDTLKTILQKIDLDNEQIMILGSGSNVLFVTDYDGIILKNEIKGIEVEDIDKENVILTIGAGVVWDEVVEFAVKNKFYGIENLSLIPGCAGASPIQNIGAYGVEIKDVFYSLEGYSIKDFTKKIFFKDDCEFGYRESIFKKKLKGKFIITQIKLLLSKTKRINTNYNSLKDYFNQKNLLEPEISDIRDAVIAIRKKKLPDPKVYGNAGSFFKNPKVTNSKLEEIKSIYPGLPNFPFDEKHSKIAAGWLIEKCGYRGKRIGNVGTHREQALVIVNYGEANGKEVIEFAREIQLKVNDEFGILLEPEVNIINQNQRE